MDIEMEGAALKPALLFPYNRNSQFILEHLSKTSSYLMCRTSTKKAAFTGCGNECHASACQAALYYAVFA